MRVFIIDEHILFRRCMLAYLKDNKDIVIVGEADSPELAIEVLQKRNTPDIFLVDMDLSNEYKTELLTNMRQAVPDSVIVMLSEIPVEEQMVESIKLGASGYLGKDIEPEALIEALFKINEGEIIFPQYLLIDQIRSSIEPPEVSAKPYRNINLTKRELEVLQLVTYGLMDKQIAEKLLVSENTVKNHMKSIRKKFGVSNRLQATLAGIEMGVTQTNLVL